jgi:hypothetical protein
MSSILKVDTIQTTAGAAPTTKDLGFAAGSVIQVVHASLGSDVFYSSSNLAKQYILTLNITPKFNTSKILVLCNLGLYINSGAAESRGNLGIERNSTVIRGVDSASGEGFFRDNDGHFKSYMTGFNFLDSPATTSTTTYKAFHRGDTYSAGGQFSDNWTDMTLMEIAQ